MKNNLKTFQRYRLYNSPEGIACIIKDDNGSLIDYNSIKDFKEELREKYKETLETNFLLRCDLQILLKDILGEK